MGSRRTYWIFTGLFAFAMFGAGIQDVRNAPELLEAADRLGFPHYFLTLLGVCKLVGVVLLLVPRWPVLKEWAYAGFAFDLGGAIVCHTVVGDTLVQTLPALICASLLALAYASYRAGGSPISHGIVPATAPSGA